MSSISRTPSIYQVRHIGSGKVYVGSAIDPRKRYREHLSVLRRGIHHSRYLQRAWDKYGKDAFVFEIIEPVLFVEDLISREQHWIDKLRASERKYGFNASPVAGSVLGIKRSDETRAKIADAARERFTDPDYYAKHGERVRAQGIDPAIRAKIAAGQRAHFADPAVRASVSDRQRARYADPDERAKSSERAKKILSTPAVRAKMSAAAKARWADPAERKKMSDWANTHPAGKRRSKNT